MPEPSTTSSDVSIVLPTMNRGAALRESLGPLCAISGVREILVVEGADPAETRSVIDSLGDPRVRLLVQPSDRPGLSAARNVGVEAAAGTWILHGEDDCWFPPDFVEILLEEAAAHDAQLVGAPWLNEPPVDVARVIAAYRAQPTVRMELDGPSGFPAGTIETPFMPAPSLVHRDVTARVTFDVRYQGNAFREETAYYVEAVRAGFRSVLTPRTAVFQLGHWDGGARAPRLNYEYWSARNNWYFIRRHGRWLFEQGYIDQRTPAGAQLAFMAERVGKVVKGATGARLRRVQARLQGSRAA